MEIEPASDGGITDYNKGYLLIDGLLNYDEALKEAKDLIEELDVLD